MKIKITKNKINTKKYDGIDVFKSFLVRNAYYDGLEEFPRVKTSVKLPEKLITFSEALKSKEYDAWVVFYEHDAKIERVWNNPRRYLKILTRFKGVISPDFSLYRNMPLCMQKWHTYKGRALAHWWQENGIEVILNIRFSDTRSHLFCFDGVEKNSVVAVGTHGCIKRREDIDEFRAGLAELYYRLNPHTIIVYGAAPDSIFKTYRDKGVRIMQFDSRFAQAHSKSKGGM